MTIDNNNIDLEQLTDYLQTNHMHKNYNGLYLTEQQVEILTRYGFDYRNYNNLKSLLFDLEIFLNNEIDCEDLELISQEIAEFSYYHDSKK
ncbi:MAG: hypothetical protein V8Q75_00090 [Bacilli bacterium]